VTVKFKLDNRTVPDGTMLLMGIRYDQSAGAGGYPTGNPLIYTYALLKAKGLWYMTGGSGKVPTAAGWGAIERWLDRDGRVVEWVKVVTETLDLYPAPSSPVDVPQTSE
jgi:hypothetical protein